VIVSSKPEKYDGSHRLVMWEMDEDGRITSRLERAEFDTELDMYYEQRAKELVRLEKLLLAGEISPVGFFISYQSMTVRDIAARVRLSQSRVRSHMTPAGFEVASVQMLKRYAKVFGIAIADFFQFIHLTDELRVEAEHSPGRVVQRLSISPRT